MGTPESGLSERGLYKFADSMRNEYPVESITRLSGMRKKELKYQEDMRYFNMPESEKDPDRRLFENQALKDAASGLVESEPASFKGANHQREVRNWRNFIRKNATNLQNMTKEQVIEQFKKETTKFWRRSQWQEEAGNIIQEEIEKLPKGDKEKLVRNYYKKVVKKADKDSDAKPMDRI